MERLDGARDEKRVANDRGDGVVQQQLDTIEVGIFEEDEGDLARAEPGSKVDRDGALRKRHDGLAPGAEGPAVTDRIEEARDHLDSNRSKHPQGG